MVRIGCVVVAIGAFMFCGMAIVAPAAAASIDTPAITDVTAPVAGVTGLSVGFQEALIRTKPTNTAEDAALVRAVEGYRHHAAMDDVHSLEAFAAAYPQSGWWLSIEVNIGLIDYQYGYYSRALAAFTAAWEHGKSADSETGHELADRAVGELLQMHAKLGHVPEVKALLVELDGKAGTVRRPLTAAGAVMHDETVTGLWAMEHRPGIAFLCGPFALRNLLAALGVPAAQYAFVEQYQSGPNGVTLAEVSRLADQAKLSHRLVFRRPGEAVPVPSIIHWKVNHFAAIVGEHDGVYEIKDPTFGPTQWITRGAIDAEGSGYFLVPDEGAPGSVKPEKASARIASVSRATDRPMSSGAAWRPVTAGEAEAIYGMGDSSGQDKNATTPCTAKAKGPCGSGGGPGMPTYDFDEMNVSLRVTDTPLGYTPPVGPPVWFTVSYIQREAADPGIPTYYNFGTLFTLNWQSFIEDNPAIAGANVTRVLGGGGGVTEGGYAGATGSFTAEVQDNSMLTMTSANPITYKRALPDGSMEIYAASNGATSGMRLIFLSQLVDPAGNAVTLTYDSSMRLTKITDAIGQVSMLSYPTSGNTLQVMKITDPFGRSASFQYNSSALAQITDEMNLTSTFGYDSKTPSLMNAMITPYGKTQFTVGVGSDTTTGSTLMATDPMGGTEFLEYAQGLTSVPTTDSVGTPSGTTYQLYNGYLNDRDTFYWNKYAYSKCSAALCPKAADLALARNRHWAHVADASPLMTSDTLESVKYALENRIWYDYPNQTDKTLGAAVRGTLNRPVDSARVLDSGQQRFSWMYNALGNISGSMDAVGRQTLLNYAANNIDVTGIGQLTASPSTYTTIASYPSYNTKHEPNSYVDAAGQTTKYTYNTYGQLATSTDAVGDLTTYNYYANSAAVGTRDQLNTIVRNGTPLYTFTYDGQGHVKTVTDNTVKDSNSQYWSVTLATDNLDRLTSETFLDGTSRTYVYGTPTVTPLDLVSFTDRQGNETQYAYNANRDLIQITDALGKLTTLTYWPDDKLKSLSDPDAVGNPPTTHTTKWAIDVEERVTSKTAADGSITNFAYDSAGRLSGITDPLKQVQLLNYDPDNELTQRVFEKTTNPTPSVAYSYDPYFPRLTQASGTNGTIRENFKYYPPGALGALKLSQEIEGANGTVSYSYDALGRPSGRTAGGSAESWAYEGTTGQMRVLTHGDALGSFTQGYLQSSNQLMSQNNGKVSTSWGYDTNTNDRRLMQVATPSGTSFGLTTTVEGEIKGLSEMPSGSGTTSLTNSYDALLRLTGVTASPGGAYTFTPDNAGNITSIARPQYTAAIPIPANTLNEVMTANGKSFGYDLDGELLTDYGRTYSWDGANRMVSIKLGSGNPTVAFTYDALGRRIAKIVTPSGGGKSTTTTYLWCGKTLCASTTSGASSATRRYLKEGEVYTAAGATTLYYYGPDQVGSVRDVLNASTGALLAHYDYDAYGLTNGVAYGTVTGTSRLTDFGYAGMVYEQTSGLSLATYRAYDPQTARWLSRDPIGISGGVNLYQYVGGRPIGFRDPEGLFFDSAAAQAALAEAEEAALLEEVAGGGPADLVADILAAGTLAAGAVDAALQDPDPTPSSGGSGNNANPPPGTTTGGECPPDGPDNNFIKRIEQEIKDSQFRGGHVVDITGGPNSLTNPDYYLGPNAVRYYVDFADEFGDITNYSVNYDPDTGNFGNIHPSSGTPGR